MEQLEREVMQLRDEVKRLDRDNRRLTCEVTTLRILVARFTRLREMALSPGLDVDAQVQEMRRSECYVG